MATPLNGWRRLAVVLTGVWLLMAGSVALLEWFGTPQGLFIREDIAAGMVVEGDKARFPDGRVVQLNARDPRTGEILPPWEIDWTNQPAVPKQRFVRWQLLFLCSLGVPAVTWLFFEMAAVVGRWVGRGFAASR